MDEREQQRKVRHRLAVARLDAWLARNLHGLGLPLGAKVAPRRILGTPAPAAAAWNTPP